MYLGAFHFDGPTDTLLESYEKLFAGFPAENIELHVAVVRDGGITVYDACPDQPTFEAFAASEEFRGALTAAGLPEPRVEGTGEVHRALLRQPVTA
ncbi:MAG: hypothetical protein JO246_14920 [Frankiaceae bacterium]|nr:hypothetical protein [Frankiaceae bacterium]MBV9872564.1 hypothetical protein [Frankiaceae bacterium]